MAKTTTTTKPADKDEIIQRLNDRVEQLEAEIADRAETMKHANTLLEQELDESRVQIANLEDQVEQLKTAAPSASKQLEISGAGGGLSLAAPYNPDTRIATVIGGRCEIQLRRIGDVCVVNSLFQHLQAQGAAVLDGRDHPVPVNRHSHAVLWLLQNLQLPGMPTAGDDQAQGGEG